MNLKTPKVEGRKNERPLEPIYLKSTKVEGHDYASPVPQASPPFGDDFEQCFKAGRKENEQRNDPARFSENPFRNYIGCPPLEPMNLKSPKVERRKKERPLQPMNLKSPKVAMRGVRRGHAFFENITVAEDCSTKTCDPADIEKRVRASNGRASFLRKK